MVARHLKERASAREMVFYILTPNKIEAHEYDLSLFLADDIMYAIQLESTKIAVDKVCLEELQKEFPTYHRYEIKIGKL